MKFELIKDVDTRDGSDLLVLKIKENVKNFCDLKRKLKGWHYSRFKKGFINKAVDVTEEELKKILQANTIIDNKKSGGTCEYFKKIRNYITLNEAHEKIKKDFKNIEFSRYKNMAQRINIWDVKLTDEEKTAVLNNQLEMFTEEYNRDYDLSYIREAIIHKSLGEDPKDLYANGDNYIYCLIWDKLPVVEGLEITKEYYSSLWGYDQTNITLAHKLNKKIWGLTIFKTNLYLGGNYMLKRVKDGVKNFNDGFMSFSLCTNPDTEYYMQYDASRTGNYR